MQDTTYKPSIALRSYKGIFPTIGDNCYIDPSCVLMGDIHIGDESSIWPLVAARGDVNAIRIGQRTNIQDGCALHVTHKNESNSKGFPLIIGDDVTVGHKAVLHGCTIGDRVLVGMGAIVLDGAVIPDDVMLGAGSLVSPGKILESGHLYVGSPAHKKRPLTDAELAFLKISADNYVRWKDDYISETQ
ncbi:gamma carbonic anhydrase family protein [Echinimonas agarilytica]|uniref:Gamma carbonic anhydrase family protein n=1 Tax=Echinimonas agarilytica TaxID=1215918 RepID=A0AA42B5N5_9GAMM|nr:gamma carbonic anhydrase family protein [Echinimonas agarilytica]MCM2678052.1 gamma carbonic anhydrase family protein [Echinimonas agarilytica]